MYRNKSEFHSANTTGPRVREGSQDTRFPECKIAGGRRKLISYAGADYVYLKLFGTTLTVLREHSSRRVNIKFT